MYTKMDFDTIEEHFDETLPGSGLALELDTRSVTSLTSTLGGKLTYAHSTSWGVLIPHLQLEWQHEFESDPAEVEMRFLFDPTATPFTIHGDPVDTDFFRFGVGMSFVMAQGRSGFFYYERLISRERFSQNSLALGIRLEF
jgi:outer membrane autotransporter protein